MNGPRMSALGVLGGIAGAALGQAEFHPMGLLPGGFQSQVSGISADGSVVVGVSAASIQSNLTRAFRWTLSEGIVSLGTLPGGSGSSGQGVSADGSRVVGFSWWGTSPYHAFLWTGGVMQDLGVPAGETFSYANAISGDGQVVAGTCGPQSNGPAVRWALPAGAESIGVLPGTVRASARALSADGSVIVGSSLDSAGLALGFRWTQAQGMLPLAPLAGFTESEAKVVSADASVIHGFCWAGATQRACRWDGGAPPVALTLPPGWTDSGVNGGSADGSIAAGALRASSITHAAVWLPTLGVVDLNTYLPTQGVNLTGWVLYTVSAVSADGSALAGHGAHNGVIEAWHARLPAAVVCYANCDASTAAPVLNINDFACFLNRFASGETYANCDHSTAPPTLNVQDFQCFLNAFAAGCP